MSGEADSPALSPRDWTQTAVRKWWSNTLARYSVGSYLNLEDRSMFERFLLERHPSPQEYGARIVGVFIGLNAYRGKTFFILKPDGTSVVVGVRRVMTGKQNTVREFIKKACRSAAQPSVFVFKDANPPKDCVECGGPAEQVDHKLPWTMKAIIDAWADPDVWDDVTEKDFAWPVVAKAPIFADEGVSENFREFHDKRRLS